MRLQLTKKPKPVDFIKNNSFFRVYIDRDIYSTPCYDTLIFKSALSVPRPHNDGKIIFTLPNGTVIEMKAIFGTDEEGKLKADTFCYHSVFSVLCEKLKSKIQDHYVLSEYYEIEIFINDDDELVLNFKCKDITNETQLEIICTGYSGEDPTIFHTPAELLDFPDNWQLYSKFRIKRYDERGYLRTLDTPKLFLHHKDWNIDVPLEILKYYLPYIDIPIFPDFYSASLIRYNHLILEFLYAEAYGTPLKVEWVQKTEEFKLLNAHLQSQYFDENKADFVLPSNQTDKLNNINTVICWGCNSGEKIRTFEGMPQYVYVNTMYCSETKIINCIAYYITSQGTTGTISKQAIALLPGYIYRLSTDLYALGIDNKDIIQYTVALSCDALTVFTRIYQVIPKPYFVRIFLLQNKYGLLESFFCDNLLEEKTVEGRKVLLNKLNEIDIQNKGTYYTARTGFKRKNELQALKYAFENRHNFIISNNKIVRISLLPDSFTLIDEEKDMQNLEFKFCVAMEAEELPIAKPTDAIEVPDLGYIRDNIVMFQDGIYNTLYGHVSENLTFWEDLTLNGNHLNMLSGAVFVIFDKSIAFNPEALNIGVPAGPIRYNSNVIEEFDKITIEICFRLYEHPISSKVMADIYNSELNRRLEFYTDMIVLKDTISRYIYSNIFNLDEIYTLAVVYNSGSVKVYENGTLKNTVTGIDSSFKVLLKEGLVIGNTVSGGQGFKGEIHSWRIYLDELDSAGIMNNYNNDVIRFSDESASGSASASGSESGSESGELLPVAEFYAEPKIGEHPLEVHFFSLCKNTKDWHWDFGDGEKMDGIENPIHIYQNAGNYNVLLRAINGGVYDDEVKPNYIQVLDTIPIADFYAEPKIGEHPLEVHFFSLCQNTNDWHWEFGDEDIMDGIENPIHVYQEAGNYTVLLLAINDYGSDEEIKEFYIQVL